MAGLEDAVEVAIRSLTLSDETPAQLRARALKDSLQDWRNATTAKVVGVGALTGLAGGPVGLALEAGDLAYLFASGGKGCLGTGYILGKEVDPDEDIHPILAIWSGAGEGAEYVAPGKIAIKAGGKMAMKAAAKAGGKVAGKIVAKAILKSNVKVSAKLVAKISAKLAAKLATKLSTKWIPFVGGAVSASINYWVIDSLLDAAESYYRSDYVVLSDELAASVAD